MAAIDLSDYSLGELKGLQFDVEKEIKQRQKQEMGKARARILEIAQGAGVEVGTLLTDGAKGAARYRNPDDDAQTWSGRGRQPKWIAEALASGRTLADFRIGGEAGD